MKKYRLTADTVLYPKGIILQFNESLGEYQIHFEESERVYSKITFSPWQIEGNSLWEEVKEETEETEERGRCRLNKGDTYWSIQEGCIVDKTEMKIYNDKWLFEQGNYFYTPQEAEEELMRIKSRAARWDFVPEEGDEYFIYYDIDDEIEWGGEWNSTTYEICNWNIGNCHRTKEDAEKWGMKYSSYFLPPQN